MLAEMMIAAATSGGMAIVQAAGTDAWAGLRTRVAELFRRSAPERELTVLERLDKTQTALRQAAPEELERLRIRQEAAWQTLFESLLEGLGESERQEVVGRLTELAEVVRQQTSGEVSAGQGGFAVGGNANIRAEGGSAAAGVINGDVHLENPTMPGADRG
ncbi:hypothetical protein [Sphaerisporangium rhizosphaerae]|uniref:Uncharacterized protein n=1 Tax=Sphaerisporangium rhizosphaerae TaxID=2269375 RepID=A0ABW2P7D1_9ACTN